MRPQYQISEDEDMRLLAAEEERMRNLPHLGLHDTYDGALTIHVLHNDIGRYLNGVLPNIACIYGSMLYTPCLTVAPPIGFEPM